MIGIFAALGRELKPIKACFPNLEEFRESGVLFSTGRVRRAPPGDINQPAAVLVQTGIGFQRAESAAKIAANRFPLKLYVSTGFAGGLRNSIRVGDLVIGQKIVSLLGSDAKVFTSDPEWTQSAEKSAEKAAGRFLGGIHLGSIATVRQIAGRSEDKKTVAKKTDAAALDMEAAAVAGVAEERRIPFIAVRAVSDVLDEDLGFDGGLLLADDGTFKWGAGLFYLASHHAAWGPLNRLRRQTNLAARSLGLFFQEFLVSPGGARPSA